MAEYVSSAYQEANRDPRVGRAGDLYAHARPNLPPLYPGFVTPETTPDVTGYQDTIKRLYGECTEPMRQAFDRSSLQLTNSEQEQLRDDAWSFMGSEDVYVRFSEQYARRFPNRPVSATQVGREAQSEASFMLQALLSEATRLPRIAGIGAFEQRRDSIFADTIGPHWRNFLTPNAITSSNLLRDLEIRLHNELFYELPVADYVRLPVSWRTAIAGAYAAEVIDMCDVLVGHSIGFLRKPTSWPYGGAGIAPSLLRGSVAGLREDLQSEPRVPAATVIDPFIRFGGEAATEARKAWQEQLTKEAAQHAAALATAQLVKPKAEKPDPAKIAYEALQADPEVKTELAALQPGSFVRIGPENEIIPKEDFERIIRKHLELVAYALRERAINDPEAPVESIAFDGFTEDRVNAAAMLTEKSHATRENAWIAILPPPDKETIRKQFKLSKNLVDRLDDRYIVRLCVAADLRSSGKPPAANMVDVVIGLRAPRAVSTKPTSQVVMMLRKPKGAQGTDYANLASRLTGLSDQQYQLKHTKPGGIPGTGHSRKHM
ncbi:MAG TPA: hypothetical protein VLE73_04660 [Candidatus Saccharimonadales bacterium]|nr:hypothetical protein [Candidatus Saccharimonadales bacterium]